MELYLSRDHPSRIDEVSMEHHEDSINENSRRKNKTTALNQSETAEIDDYVFKNQ